MPTRLPAAFVVASAGLLALACTAAETPGIADAYTNAPQLSLVEEVRYCTNEDLPECQLTDMVFAQPTPGGGVVIGIPEGPITGFDSTGTIVARFGRQGGGPGEYSFAFGVHVEPDGRVVVQDVRQSRVVIFSETGTPLLTHTVEPMFGGLLDFQFAHLGFALLWEPNASVGDSIIAEIRILRDTLDPVIIAKFPSVRRLSTEGARQPPAFFHPWTPFWAAESDSSALIAEGPALRVERYFSDGRREVLIDAPVVGNRAVTSAEVQSERDRLGASRFPPGAAALNEFVEGAASHHQFADSLAVLSDGAILLRENAYGSDSARWTVFTSTGQVTGRFTLAENAQILGGSSERMLLNSPNELGVPIIAWHRVEAGQQ